MPQMNGTGPEGKGSKTGRGLGRCKDKLPEDLLSRLGIGMGKRRQAGSRRIEGKKHIK